MKSSFIAGVFALTAFCSSSEQAFAGTVYELAFTTTELRPGLFEAIETRTVYATLELSGDSPYDHNDIESLDFTPAAAELGYVGEYQGTFDDSAGLFFDEGDGVLSGEIHSGEILGDIIVLNTLIVDFNPPPVAGSSVTGPDAYLQLSFRSAGGLSAILNGSDTPGLIHAVQGQWVRVVPEPSAVSLASLIVMFLVGWKRP